MRRLLLILAMTAGYSWAGADESRAPVEVIRPDTSFLATVSPIVSRLDNIHYFEAGPNLIGVSGENPLAKTKEGRTVLMYFDKSGEFMVIGSVMEWKKQRNVSAIAVRQFSPDSDLAKAAELAQKEEKQVTAKYKAALEKDIAVQRSRLQKTNETAKQKVDGLIKEGVPGVVFGSGPIVITAFVDLNCGHCKRAMTDLIGFAEGSGRTTHTVKMVVTANPKDGQNSNVTAMIYGSATPQAQLKKSMQGAPEFNAAMIKAGTADLTRVQGVIHALEIRTLPFFVITSKGISRKQTGYGTLQDLIK